MAIAVPTNEELAEFKAEEILKAWLNALVDGLGPGRSFEDGILDLNGDEARGLRRSIQAELERRKKLGKSFDRAAFIASTRVARDTGAICRVMADATDGKVVKVDVFQRARQLTKLHAACPTPSAQGTGPFC
jgi:hypothetical protein